ncbi:hypothetical protein [Burkholderia territorii]|uniref:hypothetical protein n=1 Tax=Burkholderia territorii TaxID=1503055 RepID=UPI000A932FEE|nr:hypothetical protein [Burkholderia territorii]
MSNTKAVPPWLMKPSVYSDASTAGPFLAACHARLSSSDMRGAPVSLPITTSTACRVARVPFRRIASRSDARSSR